MAPLSKIGSPTMPSTPARPWFVLAAGPNGAGKSTLIASSAISRILGAPEDLAGFEVLNPDRIAVSLSGQPGSRGNVSSGKEVIRRVGDAFSATRPLILETVLAGAAIERMVMAAKAKAYRIGVVFVYLRSAQLHIARVAQRVQLGGHFIPDATIRKRYERSLSSFGWLAQAADHAALLDNSEYSVEAGEPILIASKAPAQGWRVFEVGIAPPTLEAILARLVISE